MFTIVSLSVAREKVNYERRQRQRQREREREEKSVAKLQEDIE